MQVVTREIELSSRSDTIKLSFIGDIHYGGRDCDINLLKRCVAKVAEDKNHYWVGMGDYGEFINYTDKRFDPSDLDPRVIELKDLADLPRVQSNGVANILAPIKATCLGLLEGNHENKIELKYHQRIFNIICESLHHKTDWHLALGYSAIIKLRIKRSGQTKTIKIYVHHGAGGGRKKGAKVNRVQDLAVSFPNCQIYCMGHVHDR